MSWEKPPPYQQSATEPVYSATPPQQAGYTQQPPTSQTVLIQQPCFQFDTFPVKIVCPRCQASVTTDVTYENGLMTWLVSGSICVIGGIFGCFLIPFCIKSLKDCIHTCPNCQHIVGAYKRA